MDWLETLTERLSQWIWGPPLMAGILAIGLWLTVRLRGIQLRKLPQALKLAFGRQQEGEGEFTSFGALCTALAATIGTGNIVGVATAICAGGPGALFWMLTAGLLGMATQYAEGLLAVKYRVSDGCGHVLGGPFLYIQRGMGLRWRWMARLFAVFAVTAGLLGIGTLTQIRSITDAVQDFFAPAFDPAAGGVALLGGVHPTCVVLAGLLTAVGAGAVLLGGDRRIVGASQFLVPFMTVAYFLLNLLVLVCNAQQLPRAVGQVLQGAFSLRAAAGGAAGSMIVAMQKGISRGIFTNEAGMGTAAIASAAAKTRDPARQGLVAMTGTFLDTVVLCTMTGLSIVLTGAWDRGAEGAAVTRMAFSEGLPLPDALTAFLLMIALVFFAFSTILGWHFYAERCLEYLCGRRRAVILLYRGACIFTLLLGPYLPMGAVWNLADITNGLMAIPNLAALFALRQVAVGETRRSFPETVRRKSSWPFARRVVK